jgi:carboxyl-terminal processing protease
VRREGRVEPLDLELTRAIMDLPSIMGDRPLRAGGWDFRLEQNPHIGYIRVTSFGGKTPDELAAALNQLTEQNVEVLILDLRDNPGGLLDAAVETCDMFLPAGQAIVSIKGRGGEPLREYVSTGQGRWQDIPLAILVNHYSASASEIVAACLQDHRRAVIVGARTWGKGTVQHVLPIEGGESLLKLTAASYWRPSGQNIHRMKNDDEDDAWGVTPNAGMKVKLTDEQSKRLRESRAERDVLWRAPDETPDEEATPADPQLQKAVEYLEARLERD